MSRRAIEIVSMFTCVVVAVVFRWLFIAPDDWLGLFGAGCVGALVAILLRVALTVFLQKRLYLQQRGLDVLEVVETSRLQRGRGTFEEVRPEIYIGPIVFDLPIQLNAEVEGRPRTVHMTLTINVEVKFERGMQLDCHIPRESKFEPKSARARDTISDRMQKAILTEVVTNGWNEKPLFPGRRSAREDGEDEAPASNQFNDVARSARNALNFRGWNVKSLKFKVACAELAKFSGVEFEEGEAA